MKIKDLLRIEEIIEKRSTPCDLLDLDMTYYSQSKNEEIKIQNMHLQHLLRVFIKLLEKDRFDPQPSTTEHRIMAELKNLFGGLHD